MSLKIKFFLFILGATIIPTLIVGFLPLGLLSSRLYDAGLPAAAILSITAQMRDTVLAYALFLAVSFSFFSFLLYRAFGEPVADLIEAMRQVRRHNFSERVPVTSAGEIGELSEAFNEMAGQIQEYVAQLEANDKAKDEFLAVLSHELRNPLAPIATSIELMRLENGDEDPETKQLIATAARQIDILRRLLDDLLNVSRLTRGSISVDKEPLDLRNIVQSVVESTTQIVKDSGTRLVVSAPAAPVPVLGDHIRLHQAVLNLVKNATEYSQPQGEIFLELRPDGAHAVLIVRDKGAGIEKEMLPRLFNLFSRVGPVKQKPKGLGVGLYLVKKIVDLHGGTVAVRSDGLGTGTEFTIRLPLAA